MEINQIIYTLNPWINSLASMILFVFTTFIMAKLLSKSANKLISIFNIRNIAEAKLRTFFNAVPDIIEYIVYVIGFALLLKMFGVFNLAVIILLSSIGIIILLWLFLEIYGFIPNVIARSKLKTKNLEKVGKNYRIGIVNTEFKINKRESLFYKNKNLLKNLKL